MAATAEISAAFVQSFLTVGTPTFTGFQQSPREPAETTPRRKDSWASAAALMAADEAATMRGCASNKVSIVALTGSAPPTSLNMGKRSWSTLSFGDGQDAAAADSYLVDHAPAALGRFTSEDFMATLNRENSDLSSVLAAAGRDHHHHQAAAGEAPQQWGTLEGIAEGSASPTNVDFAAPTMAAAGLLMREKSTDFNRVDASALIRAQSDDLSSLLLFRQRSSAMLQSLGAADVAKNVVVSADDEAPACPPPSAESAASLLPPAKAEEAAAFSSTSSESEGEEEEEEEEPPSSSSIRRVSARNVGKPKRKLVELEDSDDDYMPPSNSSKKGSKKAKKGASSSSGRKSGGGGYAHNNRGAHVKGRPEMQETARNGQRHWATEVQELRSKWQEARCWEANAAFQPQLELMARRHIKNQHECLLRSLHIAATKGMIDPLPFNTAEGRSFLG